MKGEIKITKYYSWVCLLRKHSVADESSKYKALRKQQSNIFLFTNQVDLIGNIRFFKLRKGQCFFLCNPTSNLTENPWQILHETRTAHVP